MNEQEFQILYETHYRALKSYLLAICKNPAEAEDLTHEAFLRYEKHLPSFRKNCSDFTMLCKIGKNLWLNRKRKDKRLYPIDQHEIIEPEVFEERVLDEQEALRIHRGLHELQEPYKEVFMLRVFGELSFSKIANLFGKSESWAKMTFYRAKAKIIIKLEESDENG